jgi:Trk-type K+ transport system membrane component
MIEIPRFILIIVTIIFIILGGFGLGYLHNKYGQDRSPLWLGPVFFTYFVVSVMLIGFCSGVLPR